jgi:hypothetical protein
MLKLFFWCLLLGNAALFGYQQGYFNAFFPDGREPTRTAKQFNPEKMKLLSASEANATSVPPPSIDPTSVVLPIDRMPEARNCTETSNFDAVEAKRFETQIALLIPKEKFSKKNVQEAARHMVFIPSLGSKEGADKKSNELRHLGVKDFYIMQEGTEFKWGISLGIFKTEEVARAHLASLNQKGVRSAKLAQYSSAANKIAFQLRLPEREAKYIMEKIKADFRTIEFHSCDV